MSGQLPCVSKRNHPNASTLQSPPSIHSVADITTELEFPLDNAMQMKIAQISYNQSIKKVKVKNSSEK
jgi:hypothetical protein